MIMVESENKNVQTRINIEQVGSQMSLNSEPNKKSANGWTTMVLVLTFCFDLHILINKLLIFITDTTRNINMD